MGKQAFYGMSDMKFGKAIEYSNEMFAALCVTEDAVEGILLVGARGFEPPTSCSQSRRAARLRHAPMIVTGCI